MISLHSLLSRLRIPLTAFASVILVTRCAVISSPEGGEKDTTPPKIIRCSPPEQTTNFSGQSVTIRFDEFVQTSNLAAQTLISPPIQPPPLIYAQGKTLFVRWQGPLKPRTTYHIQLGNAVQDVNEGNPYPGLQYVFSTGPALDSCSLSGKVIQAKTGEAEPEAILLFYADSLADSFAFRKPDYITRVRKDGSFTSRYLPSARFAIYALLDKNQNYRYDQSTESFAFLDSSLLISADSTANITLALFQPQPQKTALVSHRWIHDELIEWVCNKPVDSFMVEGESVSPRDVMRFSEQKDTIYYWLSNDYFKSTPWRIRLSGGDEDTVFLSSPFLGKTRSESTENRKFTIDLQQVITKREISTDTLRALRTASDSLILFFSSPCRGIGPGKAPQATTLSGSPLSVSTRIHPDSLSATLYFPFTEQTIVFHFPDSSFMDFRDRPLQGRVIIVQQTPAQTGTLHVRVNQTVPSTGDVLLQLLSSEKKIVSTRNIYSAVEQTVHWNEIPEGRYYFRIIKDLNGDGQWTTGSVFPRQQPEPVYWFSTPLELKASWELETEIKIPWP